MGARERKRSGEVSKQNAKKFSFDDGLQVLIEALQSRLEEEILTASPIDSLERTDDGWLVELAGCPIRVECSAVVLALPSHKIAALDIRTEPKLEVASLGEVYYPPVASVVLGFRRSDVAHPLDGFGMLVPEKEGCNISGRAFLVLALSHIAPRKAKWPSPVTLAARALRHCRYKSADELVEMTWQDLRTILGVRGRPTFQNVTVFRKAIPQYNVGFAKYRALMNDMEVKAPGLFVAGHARDGISLSDSIVSGHNTAGRIQTFLASNQTRPAAVPHPLPHEQLEAFSWSTLDPLIRLP